MRRVGLRTANQYLVKTRKVFGSKRSVLSRSNYRKLRSIADHRSGPVESAEYSEAFPESNSGLWLRVAYYLTDRQYLTLSKRMGGLSLDEVARMLKVTRERARQIEQQAILKLRKKVEEKSLTFGPELV